ncbi:MAG: hypothetical protein R3C44_14845 [Chloroflexota bacterium]
MTAGGAFAGRDYVIQGDAIGGDAYELSGDFRGSAVNINSRLEHATQSVTTMPHGTPEEREHLAGLLTELRGVLARHAGTGGRC